jgi:Uri superfamily endonuclease
MKTEDQGLYILVINVEKGQKIKVAKLPETYYQPGFYLYVGRAKRGLRKRVDRHLRSDKKLFWHIDYLLQKSKVDEVWIKHDSLDECRAAKKIAQIAKASVILDNRFGASDCRCPGHLVYLSEFDDLSQVRKRLAFERIRVHGIPI